MIIPSHILQCTIVRNKEPKNGCCLEHNRLISLFHNGCLHKHFKMFQHFRTINVSRKIHVLMKHGANKYIYEGTCSMFVIS